MPYRIRGFLMDLLGVSIVFTTPFVLTLIMWGVLGI